MFPNGEEYLQTATLLFCHERETNARLRHAERQKPHLNAVKNMII